MVGLGGLEPPTLRLSGVRSNQLSYRPTWIFGPGRERPQASRTRPQGVAVTKKKNRVASISPRVNPVIPA